MAPCKMMKENARRMHGSARKNCKILHQSTILHLILHPILHPKSLVNTTGFFDGCRKCRRFSETFFVGGGEKHGPEVAKHRTSLIESTDVLHQKCRCFHQRSPMFLFSEKADDSPVHGMPLWRRLPCGIGPPTKIQIMITNLDKRQVQPYQRIFFISYAFLGLHID